MKKFKTIIIVALVLILQNCDTESSQGEDVSKKNADLVKIVRLTDSLYTSFNDNLDKYRKVTAQTFETSESGEVVRYFEEDILRLIQVKNYGDMGRTTTDYFFYKNQVVYIHKIEQYYNMPFYMKDSKVETELKNQYYIGDNNLMKWIDDKGNVVADSCYAKQMGLLNEQIVKYSEKLEKN